MKEKKAVEETPLDIKKLKNKEGRFLVTAVHKPCGTKLAKICGKDDAEKIAKFLGKSVDKLEYHVKAVKKGKGEDDEYDGADDDDDKCNYAYAVGSAQKRRSKSKSGHKVGSAGKKRKSGGSAGKKRKSGGKGSKGKRGGC